MHEVYIGRTSPKLGSKIPVILVLIKRDLNWAKMTRMTLRNVVASSLLGRW